MINSKVSAAASNSSIYQPIDQRLQTPAIDLHFVDSAESTSTISGPTKRGLPSWRKRGDVKTSRLWLVEAAQGRLAALSRMRFQASAAVSANWINRRSSSSIRPESAMNSKSIRCDQKSLPKRMMGMSCLVPTWRSVSSSKSSSRGRTPRCGPTPPSKILPYILLYIGIYRDI